MLGMEEILSEVNGREEELNEQGLPPGFRFHPTDEELITFYLASKVFKGNFSGVHIAQVDLNRCEPWELPDVAKMGEREWYFYSLRDRKYPTGLRTNRATGAGYWKATGKDREVYSASNGGLLGMKKTLVFYKGRAPRGEKTKWVMHEYRLDGDFSYRHPHPHPCKEEWVICRIFHKNVEKKNAMFSCQSYLMECGGLSSPSSTTSNALPPLLDTNPNPNPNPTTLIHQAGMQPFHNPFQIHHPPENDLNSFVISSVMSQSNHHLISSTDSSFSHKPHIVSINTNPNPITSNNIININPIGNMYAPSSSSSSMLLPSILFKSIHSHQDSTLQCDDVLFKQFKAESNFKTHFESAETNSNLFMDIKMQPINPPCYHQNPLFSEMKCNSPTAPTPAAADAGVCVHDISTSIAFNRPAHQTAMLDPRINIVHAHGDSWPLGA